MKEAYILRSAPDANAPEVRPGGVGAGSTWDASEEYGDWVRLTLPVSTGWVPRALIELQP